MVNVYDVGTGTSMNISVEQNYLVLDNATRILNDCEERNFVVQAVIGSRASENSSIFSSPNSKYIHLYQ